MGPLEGPATCKFPLVFPKEPFMSRIAIFLVMIVLAGCANRPTTAEQAPPDSEQIIAAYTTDAKSHVVDFFNEPYPAPFETRVFPDRRSLDAFVAERWKMPATECWMVAMGVGPIFVLLDPADWKAEACEHDADDERHVRQIITHELVHVFHGQHCPRPEFDGMDDAGWFVEGLAIYAAGQLDEHREAQAREAAAAGLPRALRDAWSGSARYAVAGSLVRHLDQTRGREALKRLMRAVSNDELLAMLGTTEDRLLSDWRAWVLAK